MTIRQLRLWAMLGLVSTLAGGMAWAKPPATKSSIQAAQGNTPGLLPVSTFARHPLLSSPRLSPDGKHLLVRVDGASGKEHSLVVYKLSDMSVTSDLRMPVYQLPLNPMWVSNNWIALEIGKKYGSLDKPLKTGQVIATRIDGKRQRYLYGDENHGRRSTTRGSDQGFGYIVGRPEIPNGHLYLRAEPWGRNDFSILYDINVPRNARHLLAHMNVHGMQFLVSPEGKAAYAFGNNVHFDYVFYRHQGERWAKLTSKQMGDYFAPLTFTPDHKRIYALVNPDSGPAELISENLDGSQRKVLAKNTFASVGNIQWTASPLRPFATIPEAGVPKPTFFNKNSTDAKLYRALQKVFPGEAIDFINFSQDGGKLLFYVSSDRDPGTYYLIDTRTHKLRKLFALAPWIKPAQMASRQPFRFKADDGMMLEGILTFPPHRAHHNLPMVLVPHGGPYGIRDTWYFDEDAQFLANRGYLVLQVNFRGSGGRGVTFENAGFRKWGTRIQQDLIDGVKWAIAQHYADPGRICVYGGSFGGYSAMMSVIRAPHLFQCAIGYSGVYNLADLYEHGDIQSTDSGQSYLSTVLGHDQKDLAANSPVKLAAKIDVPVFLAHGEDDRRAPFSQAEAMRDALEAAHRTVEWMAVDGEGHGFYTEKDRAAFLTKMQAFLEKYIGPGALPNQGQRKTASITTP